MSNKPNQTSGNTAPATAPTAPAPATASEPATATPANISTPQPGTAKGAKGEGESDTNFASGSKGTKRINF